MQAVSDFENALYSGKIDYAAQVLRENEFHEKERSDGVKIEFSNGMGPVIRYSVWREIQDINARVNEALARHNC